LPLRAHLHQSRRVDFGTLAGYDVRMLIFAQTNTVPAPVVTIAWGPILLFGCGGAFLLFAVIAIVIFLMAAGQRREER
jgi:hypothetical protein